MAVTKAQLAANQRHQAKLYRIPVYIPQEHRGFLEEHAKSRGFDSLNAYTKALYEADAGIEFTKKDTEN